MTIEKTFIMLKPDCIKRGLVGEIISRFEKAGIKIVAMKFLHVDRDFSKKHYSDHVGKGFYDGLENFLISGPVVALVLEGNNVVKVIRKMVGSTEPNSAEPGTIRADYSHISYEHADKNGGQMPNIIHASDSVENATKEISLWFSQNEIFDNYKTLLDKLVEL